MRNKLIKKSCFVYLSGKPMIRHVLRCQGLVVDHYDLSLDASNIGHPRLSLIQGSNLPYNE